MTHEARPDANAGRLADSGRRFSADLAGNALGKTAEASTFTGDFMGADLSRLSCAEFDAELAWRLERLGATVQAVRAVLGPQADAMPAREAQHRWAEAEAARAALNEAWDELARRKGTRLGRIQGAEVPGGDRFHVSYESLEARMKALADVDGDVFLPNPEPPGPADYIFVCMEPSLGRWARTPHEAKARVEAGFRNFVSSVEDFILHFCIRQYLCAPGERYHLTDLSKGAMLAERASLGRNSRYDRWYGLLLEELDLIAKPAAGIFTVGNAVARHLARRGFARPFTPVMHYSGQAGLARSAAIAGREHSFEKFRNSVSHDLLISTAKDVLDDSVPASLRDETLARLTESQLSLSRQQLIFTYKLAFEGYKRRRSAT